MKSGTTISSASMAMLDRNGIVSAGFTVSVPETVTSGVVGWMSVSCAVLMSNSLNLDGAKQAIGFADKHGDDHRQRDWQLQLVDDAWDVGAGEIFQHAHHEAARDGAGRAAQAP